VIFSFIKKLLIALTITVLPFTSIVKTPKAQVADITTSICQYVVSDNKKRIPSFLQANKLKIHRIFDGIQCNGKDLLAFVSTSSSVKTYSLMI